MKKHFVLISGALIFAFSLLVACSQSQSPYANQYPKPDGGGEPTPLLPYDTNDANPKNLVFDKNCT